MKRLVSSLLVITALVTVDQGAKLWVRHNVAPHNASALIPNLLDLTHVQNKGVSFSFLANLADNVRAPLLIVISVLAMALLAWYWWRQREQLDAFSSLAFQLILAGAAGNLIDRALYGAVTDFLHFRFYATSFFVNNVADILISAGVIAYLIGMLRQHRKSREA